MNTPHKIKLPEVTLVQTSGCIHVIYVICYTVFFTFCPLFPVLPVSLVALCQTMKSRGESCLRPGPEEQLQHKPAKLTRSPRASHKHYSNQSILDHPDTLDIWVSVSSSPSPSVSPPPFFDFLLAFHLSRSLALAAASTVRDWQRFRKSAATL